MADYKPEDVRDLIGLLFDEDKWWGPSYPERPDGDMPRGCSSKATQGTWMAELADIDRAWKKAPLTDVMRRRLFLCYGVYWTQQEVAFYEEATQQAVAKSLAEGERVILKFLNGKEWTGDL